MAARDVELVKRAIDGWVRLDWSTVPEVFDADAVWVDHRRPEGEFRGLDGIREASRSWVGTWESYASEWSEPVPGSAGAVYAEVRERARGKGSGAEVETAAASVWWVEDGRITRLETYADFEQARAAAGLPAAPG